jgi:hypothetical protein
VFIKKNIIFLLTSPMLHGQRILQYFLLRAERPSQETSCPAQAAARPKSWDATRARRLAGAGAELSLTPFTTPHGGTLTRDRAVHEASRRPDPPGPLIPLLPPPQTHLPCLSSPRRTPPTSIVDLPCSLNYDLL